MTLRAAALAAIALAGCSRQVELLPPLLCPASIDVYGDDDTLFAGCGGPAMLLPSRSGLFAPGQRDYDATLAGRLQAALTSDAELGRRFGVPFRVRACGLPGAALSSLAPESAVTDECPAPDAPALVPDASTSCSDDDRAPLVVVVASEPRDRCHGGGGTARGDDEAAYAKHFGARLDALLKARLDPLRAAGIPTLAVIGPQTEWTPLPGAALEMAGTCTWPRGGWARSALATWQAAHQYTGDVLLEGDLQAAFKRHSGEACCQALGLPCEQPEWLARPSPMQEEPARVTCEGAERIVAFWVAVVRGVIGSGSGQFECKE